MRLATGIMFIFIAVLFLVPLLAHAFGQGPGNTTSPLQLLNAQGVNPYDEDEEEEEREGKKEKKRESRREPEAAEDEEEAVKEEPESEDSPGNKSEEGEGPADEQGDAESQAGDEPEDEEEGAAGEGGENLETAEGAEGEEAPETGEKSEGKQESIWLELDESRETSKPRVAKGKRGRKAARRDRWVSGLEGDRERVLEEYGHPSGRYREEIMGRVVETWVYSDKNKTFTFEENKLVDER